MINPLDNRSMQSSMLSFAKTVRAKWQDYVELCKPRVVALMMLTALVGMQLATDSFVPIKVFILGSLGIALMAGSAAAINHLIDQHIDRIMARTQRRPLPTGRLNSREAWYFTALIGLTGLAILFMFINRLTALLTLATLIGYAIIYTLYLKRATPQNIVIGGIAGAAPPMLGWTAVTGHLHPNSLLLVLIIFAWTPPHFWALAIHRQQDYAKAKIPMLPVTHGIQYTKINILLYTLLLTACSLLPYAIGMCGLFYLIGTIFLNLIFIGYAIALLKSENDKFALRTFHYSIFYLMVLFVVLLVDHFL